MMKGKFACSITHLNRKSSCINSFTHASFFRLFEDDEIEEIRNTKFHDVISKGLNVFSDTKNAFTTINCKL